MMKSYEVNITIGKVRVNYIQKGGYLASVIRKAQKRANYLSDKLWIEIESVEVKEIKGKA